jgi:hypothetical protein
MNQSNECLSVPESAIRIRCAPCMHTLLVCGLQANTNLMTPSISSTLGLAHVMPHEERILLPSDQSLYNGELKPPLRTRLTRYTHARCMR